MSLEERLTARIVADTTEAVEGFRRVEREAQRLQASVRQVAFSFSGVVTAGMALYGSFASIRNAQVAVAAAAKEVHESEVTVAEYRRRLAEATRRYGADSQEVALILERIRVNEELLAVKEERLRIAHENVAKAYIYTAATVVPNLITGLESTMRLYESLRGLKAAVAVATYAEAAAEGTKAGAVSAATAVQWLYNKALAVTHALSGPVGWAVLGVAAAVSAAAVAWMAAARRQDEYNRVLSRTVTQTREVLDLEGELSRLSPIERLQREYVVVKRYYEAGFAGRTVGVGFGGVSVSIGSIHISAGDLGSSLDRDRAAEDLAKRIGRRLALRVISR